MHIFYLASNNAHKAEEIDQILKKMEVPIEVRSANQIGGMPDVIEDADSFEGNAKLKLNALIAKIPEGSFAIADDSGICVDALGGSPGIYSARYAGKNCDDHKNNAKILRELEGISDIERSARYVCSIAWGDRSENFAVEATCEGHILDGLYGEGGFGYDPLFQPIGYNCSMGQIPAEEKNCISHRYKALIQFVAFFSK